MGIKLINDDNHDEIIKSNKLVVLKFGAEWCPPCQMIAPELKTLAEEVSDVTVAEGDIDTGNVEKLKAKYDVQTIPHVVLLKDGEVVEHFAGFKPKVAIIELINKHR